MSRIMISNSPTKKTTEELRSLIEAEFLQSGWSIDGKNFVPPLNSTKQEIRDSHKLQRIERSSTLNRLILSKRALLLSEFAEGREIDPKKFEPVLVPVDSVSPDNDLFRFATLLWSIPVSQGYGRRMRFLVRDAYNGKIVGIFGLMDPVFNLKVRDQQIGWDHHQRADRLYNVMDAFVLGAVPPYNILLGGKMIALATISDQVRAAFTSKYSGQTTIIRGAQKSASLVLVTTTSGLGQSSIYNRIQLPGEPHRAFQSIGFSGGWGHFHISETTFTALRDWLRDQGSTYADRHQYRMGPNWRFRTIRQALNLLGFEGDTLKHGIKREVFMAPLASNFKEFLRSESTEPDYIPRNLSELSSFFRERWMIPRSQRVLDWCNWPRELTWSKIAENLDASLLAGNQLSLF